ncbi:hypothetical protein GCM10010411_69220 [Actinomadura fulvescens]|uniref:Uncharacterized protein n=1 Tax=Actinomadura fulvescens TaxID=46160 RepID=A0ABN3QD20_9ACTN
MPEEPVDLKIDQPGSENAVPKVQVRRVVRDALADLGDHTVLDADESRREYAGRTTIGGGSDQAVRSDQL